MLPSVFRSPLKPLSAASTTHEKLGKVTRVGGDVLRKKALKFKVFLTNQNFKITGQNSD